MLTNKETDLLSTRANSQRRLLELIPRTTLEEPYIPLYLHDETLTLPIHEHLQLHASQYKQKTQHPSHPLHKHATYFKAKKTLFLTMAATKKKHSH